MEIKRLSEALPEIQKKITCLDGKNSASHQPLCPVHKIELYSYYSHSPIWHSEMQQGCKLCQKEERTREEYEQAGIPLRYMGVTLENYKGEKEVFKEFGNKPFDVVLAGNVGTGKTHLAVSLLKKCLEAKLLCRYKTLAVLVRGIKEAWRSDSKYSESDVLDYYSREIQLFVIDEIGVQFGSPTEKQYLTEIINNRYNNYLQTILVGNANSKELGELLGDRILDRIKENGKIFVFTHNSFREKGNFGNGKQVERAV